MWLMLQQDQPGDYVLATGQAHTVREFVERAFWAVGRPLVWRGEGVEERGLEERTGRVRVEVDRRYFRPLEVPFLLGNAAKARAMLGWEPATSFGALVQEMVMADLHALRCDRAGGRTMACAAE
jgi:GDPmannose 4,6-dehydratase